MWGWIAQVVTQAAGFFFNSSGGLTNTDAKDAVVGVYSGLQSLSNFLQALLGNEMTAWKKAGPQVVDGGRGLGNLAFNELYAWNRLLNRILPGSVRWTIYSVHHYVDPKFGRIWNLLGRINREVGQLFRWRHGYVNPTLAEWTRWRRWFYTWPAPTLATVHNWLRQPWRFAKWATPVLVPSFLAWLAPPHHKAQRDDLTRIIVGALDDMPDQVGWAVYHALSGPLTK